MSTIKPADREKLKARFRARIKIRALVNRLRKMTPAERERFVQGFLCGLKAKGKEQLAK